MGYSVSEPTRNILHWLFVKRDYRGMGIGHQLLDETTKPFDLTKPYRYTHRTKASARFLGTAWEHDPVPARVKA